MQRIYGSDVEPDKFGAGKNGFRPSIVGQSGTVVTPEWLDAIQESKARLVDLYGGADDDGTNNSQLLRTLKTLMVRRAAQQRDFGVPAGADYGVHLNDVASSFYATVAVGEGGVAQATNTGGKTWTSITVDQSYSGHFHGCAANDFYTVAVGQGKEIQRISNPFFDPSFTQVESGGSDLFDIEWAVFSNLFVAVGDGVIAELAYTGAVLKALDVPGVYRDVATDGTVFVAVGDDGAVARRDASGAWEYSTLGDDNIQCVAFVSGTGFVATSIGNGMYLSKDDGKTWEKKSSEVAANLLSTGSVLIAYTSNKVTRYYSGKNLEIRVDGGGQYGGGGHTVYGSCYDYGYSGRIYTVGPSGSISYSIRT